MKLLFKQIIKFTIFLYLYIWFLMLHFVKTPFFLFLGQFLTSKKGQGAFLTFKKRAGRGALRKTQNMNTIENWWLWNIFIHFLMYDVCMCTHAILFSKKTSFILVIAPVRSWLTRNRKLFWVWEKQNLKIITWMLLDVCEGRKIFFGKKRGRWWNRTLRIWICCLLQFFIPPFSNKCFI